jgi:hypothetical protein
VPQRDADISFKVPVEEGGELSEDNVQAICKPCSILKAAGALNAASNVPAFLIQRWWRLWTQSNYRRFALEILAIPIATILALFVAEYFLGSSGPPASSTFKEQIAALDATERSLDQLESFIEAQRAQMESDQRALADLQERRASLEPLVKADQAEVDAILRVQDQRNQERAGRERIIAFGLGFLSSLAVSGFLALVALVLKKVAVRRSRRARVVDSAAQD